METEDELEVLCRARVGSTLAGKWHLDRLLGVGGMAAVYRATHRNGATAALKVLHARYAQVPEICVRFQREAYIANKIDHASSAGRSPISFRAQIAYRSSRSLESALTSNPSESSGMSSNMS